MKTMKKIIFFVFSCIAFSNATHCFSNNGRPNYALTGALVGGAASGGSGKGFGYGLLAGAALDAATAPTYDSREYRSDDDYYYERQERRKAQKKHRSVKQQLEDCEDENDALKDE